MQLSYSALYTRLQSPSSSSLHMSNKHPEHPYKTHIVNVGFKQFLELTKVSITSVARHVDRTRMTVSSWKSGRYMPSVESFFRLVWFMNTISPGAGDFYLDKVRQDAVADMEAPSKKE